MPRPNAPRVAAAQRDARALELRAGGASFRAIAEQLGCSVSTAWTCVDRGLAATRQEPSSKLRVLERERLDRLQHQAVQVLQAQHVVIQGGEVVTDKQGKPYVDHGPTLAAITTLLKIMERRARLEGLDAPARLDAKVDLSNDRLEAEIRELEAQLALEDPNYAADMRRNQQRRQDIERFRLTWSAVARTSRDPAGFVAAALELTIGLLDLDDQQREAAAAEVERFLWTRAAR